MNYICTWHIHDTHWKSNGIMCCHYRTRLQWDLIIIMAAYSANTNGRFYCLAKDQKDYRNWNHYLTSGNGPSQQKPFWMVQKQPFWIEFVQKLLLFFTHYDFALWVGKNRNDQTIIVVPFVFLLFRVIWMCKLCIVQTVVKCTQNWWTIEIAHCSHHGQMLMLHICKSNGCKYGRTDASAFFGGIQSKWND